MRRAGEHRAAAGGAAQHVAVLAAVAGDVVLAGLGAALGDLVAPAANSGAPAAARRAPRPFARHVDQPGEQLPMSRAGVRRSHAVEQLRRCAARAGAAGTTGRRCRPRRRTPRGASVTLAAARRQASSSARRYGGLLQRLGVVGPRAPRAHRARPPRASWRNGSSASSAASMRWRSGPAIARRTHRADEVHDASRKRRSQLARASSALGAARPRRRSRRRGQRGVVDGAQPVARRRAANISRNSAARSVRLGRGRQHAACTRVSQFAEQDDARA